MSKLRVAISRLGEAVNRACPTRQLQSLSNDGEGQVIVQLLDAEGNKVVVNACFLDPDDYPRSSIILQVDEDRSKCPDRLVEKVASLSERFQDGAQLCTVLSKVGDQLVPTVVVTGRMMHLCDHDAQPLDVERYQHVTPDTHARKCARGTATHGMIKVEPPLLTRHFCTSMLATGQANMHISRDDHSCMASLMLLASQPPAGLQCLGHPCRNVGAECSRNTAG